MHSPVTHAQLASNVRMHAKRCTAQDQTVSAVQSCTCSDAWTERNTQQLSTAHRLGHFTDMNSRETMPRASVIIKIINRQEQIQQKGEHGVFLILISSN